MYERRLPGWLLLLLLYLAVWGGVITLGVYFYYGDLLWTTYTIESLPWAMWWTYILNTLLVTLPTAGVLSLVAVLVLIRNW